MKRGLATIIACIGLMGAQPAPAQENPSTLSVLSHLARPNQRDAMQELIDDFKATHPGVNVTLRSLPPEAMIPQLNDLLVNDPPDVLTLVPGEPVFRNARRGLLTPVDALCLDPVTHAAISHACASVIQDGHAWGVPVSVYPWGMFYRRDIYQALGITVPSTWDEEKAACAALRAEGYACYSVADRGAGGPVAWVDLLVLRMYGTAFRDELLHGRLAWTDPRISAVLSELRGLIADGAFDIRPMSVLDTEPGGDVANGRAAAALMGFFEGARLQAQGLSDDQLGFYRFVTVDPAVALAEVAPMVSLHIAANAPAPDLAMAFLRHAATPHAQTRLNEADMLGLLPAHADAFAEESAMAAGAFEFLTTQTPGGFVPFFDTVVPPRFYKAAQTILRGFFVDGADLVETQQLLEDARLGLYRSVPTMVAPNN